MGKRYFGKNSNAWLQIVANRVIIPIGTPSSECLRRTLSAIQPDRGRERPKRFGTHEGGEAAQWGWKAELSPKTKT